MGRLKLARNIIKTFILIGTILIIAACENDLQNFILNDLFGPPYRKEVAKLLPTNGSTTESFGYAVDIDRNYAIVGAPFGDNGATLDTGAAYIFTKGSNGAWGAGQRIVASDGVTDDSFGSAVAIFGDWAVVGANDKDSNAGRIYIYKRDSGGTWNQEQNLSVTNMGFTSSNDELGYSVALDSSWMVIGARNDENNASGTDYGAVYILKLSGSSWVFDTKIQGDITTSDDALFGGSVDINGGDLAIGAYYEDLAQTNQGAVFLYRYSIDSWVYSDKVIAKSPGNNAIFGATVSISSNYLISGAPWQSVGGFDLAGAAGLYTRTGTADWHSVSIQELKATTPQTEDWYGMSSSTDGSYILIGVPYKDDFATNSGVVFLYGIDDSGTSSYLSSITPSDIKTIQGFGSDIAVDGYTLIAGATDIISAESPGAAYIFE